MSAILESLLDDERRAECRANDGAVNIAGTSGDPLTIQRVRRASSMHRITRGDGTTRRYVPNLKATLLAQLWLDRRPDRARAHSRLHHEANVRNGLQPRARAVSPRSQSMHDEDQRQNGLRIMVVDDNHDAASTVSTLLELEGYRTGTVHNGLEAVREATRVHYDAVLLDLAMPIMDGFQAAAVLRELWPAPVLIAYSAWDGPAMRRRTADLGFSMHLRKPVSFQALNAALQSLLLPTGDEPNPA